MAAVAIHPASIEFDVHVRPGGSRTEVAGEFDGVLAVRLSAPPSGGRANEALVELLAASFDVSKRAMAIVAGSSSRRKRVRIDGDGGALAKRHARLMRHAS